MPAHQHAILGLAQVGDAHGKPDADRRERNGEGEGGDIGEHAVAEIVRFLPGFLVTRKVEARQLGWLGRRIVMQLLDDGVTPQGLGLRRIAWPELQHAVLFLRRDGPLNLHCFGFRNLEL